MDNFNEVNNHANLATEAFTNFIGEVNATIKQGKFLTPEQINMLAYRNARAEQAKTLRAAIADPEVTTQEQLVELIRHSLSLAEIRKNLAGEGLLKSMEEAKLGFLQVALYCAQKTEADEEREFGEFMSGTLKREEY